MRPTGPTTNPSFAHRAGRCFSADCPGEADKSNEGGARPFAGHGRRKIVDSEYRYAALAFEPPLGFGSPPLGVLPSDDDFLLSSLFVLLESLESVFAGDFASLELDLDSLLEGFELP